VFVDFIAAQIKTLSFLAYIIRIYQESINVHSAQMVKGMLGLLTMCPQEVAHLRKELLIAARHILATDLRNSKPTVSNAAAVLIMFLLCQGPFAPSIVKACMVGVKCVFEIQDGVLVAGTRPANQSLYHHTIRQQIHLTTCTGSFLFKRLTLL